MSNRAAVVQRMCNTGVIAMLRTRHSEQLPEVAEALLAGGVDCIEITMNTPSALEVIATCHKAMNGRAMIGVGTVLDGEMARQAVRAGAQFVVSPVFNMDVLTESHAADVPCMPGALTPTEVQLATREGADLVKVFPAGVFGPGYIKDLLAPMPHLKPVPTGGVSMDTAADWIAAGAVALGVGSALATQQMIADGHFDAIRGRAEQLVQIVAETRKISKTGN